MLWAGLRDDVIAWAFRRDSLENLLQLPFRIYLKRLLRKTLNILPRLIQHKAADGFDIAVQIHRSNQSFIRIGQNGSPLAPAARFFASSHHEISAQADINGVDFQSLTGNEP